MVFKAVFHTRITTVLAAASMWLGLSQPVSAEVCWESYGEVLEFTRSDADQIILDGEILSLVFEISFKLLVVYREQTYYCEIARYKNCYLNAPQLNHPICQ